MFLFSVLHFSVLRHWIQCSNALLSCVWSVLLTYTLSFYCQLLYFTFMAILFDSSVKMYWLHLVNTIWLLDFVFHSLFYVFSYFKHIFKSILSRYQLYLNRFFYFKPSLLNLFFYFKHIFKLILSRYSIILSTFPECLHYLLSLMKVHFLMWFVIIFFWAHSRWEFYPFRESHEPSAMKVFL